MRNGYRTLYKTMRNGELFCVLLAEVEEDRLFVRRVDFQEWERTGAMAQWKSHTHLTRTTLQN